MPSLPSSHDTRLEWRIWIVREKLAVRQSYGRGCIFNTAPAPAPTPPVSERSGCGTPAFGYQLEFLCNLARTGAPSSLSKSCSLVLKLRMELRMKTESYQLRLPSNLRFCFLRAGFKKAFAGIGRSFICLGIPPSNHGCILLHKSSKVDIGIGNTSFTNFDSSELSCKGLMTASTLPGLFLR